RTRAETRWSCSVPCEMTSAGRRRSLHGRRDESGISRRWVATNVPTDTPPTSGSGTPASARSRRRPLAAQNLGHDERRGRGEKQDADGCPRLHQGLTLIRYPDHGEREGGARHDADDADRVTDLVQVGEVHGRSFSSLTETRRQR